MSKRRGGARRTQRTRGGAGWSPEHTSEMIRDVVSAEGFGDGMIGFTLTLRCGHKAFSWTATRSKLPRAAHCYRCAEAVREAARDVAPARGHR